MLAETAHMRHTATLETGYVEPESLDSLDLRFYNNILYVERVAEISFEIEVKKLCQDCKQDPNKVFNWGLAKHYPHARAPKGICMRSKDWFRSRPYLHFDSRVGAASRAKVETLVNNPVAVAAHGFHPFLRYEKDKPKFVLNEETQKREFEMGSRPICYAAHWDAHIYSFYSHLLNNHYEDHIKQIGINENVIAFRKIYCESMDEFKSNIHLANDAFNAIQDMGNCKVFAFDIKKFFDSLDAVILKQQWCAILGSKGLPEDHYNVFRSVTKFSVIERDVLFERFKISKKIKKQAHLNRICTPKQFDQEVRANKMIQTITQGIPQGSPISATLANIYMLSFDKMISDQIKNIGGKYYRYCDDILLVIPTHETLDIELLVNTELRKIKLELNHRKTDKSIFYRKGNSLTCDKAIQYLGFVFDGKVKSIRPGSIAYFKSDVRKVINSTVAAKIRHDKNQTDLNLPKRPIHMKRILRTYSHLGKRTFITYGQRAQVIMESNEIRLQVAGMHRFLDNQIKWARSIT